MSLGSETDAASGAPGGRPEPPGAEYRPDSRGAADQRQDAGEGDSSPRPTAAAGGRHEGEAESSAAATEPSSPSPQPPAPARQGPGLACSLIGATKAGKTSLLDACEQACADPAAFGDPVQLEYLGGADTKQQAERSARAVAGGYRLPATGEVHVYDAFLTATWRATFWRPEKRVGLHLNFVDGPGGGLFPLDSYQSNPVRQLWERQLIDGAQKADAIILCVDSCDPQLDRLSQYLRTILTAVALPDYIKPSSLPLGHRLRAALGRAADPPPVMSRRLRAKRFLLLLTKIDRVVSGPPDGKERWNGSGPTPLAIAQSLSPLDVACELVHASNLLRILAVLRPDAELAVGLTSAWGFAPSGYPFMEESSPVRLSNQPSDRRTSDWRPFGVREIFQFLLDGRAAGPVERITRERLASSGCHALDVPSWYFA
jgi:hypothetical protein